MWRQENAFAKYEKPQDQTQAGLSNIGVRPEPNIDVDINAEPDLGELDTEMDPTADLGDVADPGATGGAPTDTI